MNLTDSSCLSSLGGYIRVVLAVEVSVALNMCWIQLQMVSLYVDLGTRTRNGPLFAVAMSQCSCGHRELVRSDGLTKPVFFQVLP